MCSQDEVKKLNLGLDVLLKHQENFQNAINSAGCLEEIAQTFINHVRIGFERRYKIIFLSDNKTCFSRSYLIVTTRFWV